MDRDPNKSKFKNWLNQKFKIFKIRFDILIPFILLIKKTPLYLNFMFKNNRIVGGENAVSPIPW